MVDDIENLTVGVVPTNGTATDGEVDLLRVVVDGEAVGDTTRPLPRHPAVAGREITERDGDCITDLVVVDFTGDGDNRRPGRVVVEMEAADVVGGDRPNGVAIPRRVAAETVVGEQLARQRAQGDIVG